MSITEFLASAVPAPAPAPAAVAATITSAMDYNVSIAHAFSEALYTVLSPVSNPPLIKTYHFQSGADRSEFIRRFSTYQGRYCDPRLRAACFPHKDAKTKCFVGFCKFGEGELLAAAVRSLQG